MTHKEKEFSTFADALKKALAPKIDPNAESFLDMMAEDCLMTFPYAPESGVKEIRTRSALKGYLETLSGILSLDSIAEPTVYHTSDPDTVILEFTATGHGVTTNKPYQQTYISVIHLKDGKIQHYKDYWNPLVALEALGSLEGMKKALEA